MPDAFEVLKPDRSTATRDARSLNMATTFGALKLDISTVVRDVQPENMSFMKEFIAEVLRPDRLTDSSEEQPENILLK